MLLLCKHTICNKKFVILKVCQANLKQPLNGQVLIKRTKWNVAFKQLKTSELLFKYCDVMCISSRAFQQASALLQNSSAVPETKLERKDNVKSLVQKKSDLSRLLGLAKPEAKNIAGTNCS